MMDGWIEIVTRQLILYSLPVLISLTFVTLGESRINRVAVPHPFFAITGRAVWLPLIASIAFHRGMIVAPGGILTPGVKGAAIRCAMHLLLTLAGLLVYTLSLSHMAPTGLPPLHHWWAKVLMFFNLCMAALHLLPLPGQLAGEWLLTSPYCKRMLPLFEHRYSWLIMPLVAASPLPDLLLGGTIVFPVYESLCSHAMHWSQQGL
ncbi:hypothetical protein FE236_02995 [Mariprofundus erugo]|nr:hypothetical protein FE236_02995 [Mariprofundus erugo]